MVFVLQEMKRTNLYGTCNNKSRKYLYRDFASISANNKFKLKNVMVSKGNRGMSDMPKEIKINTELVLQACL